MVKIQAHNASEQDSCNKYIPSVVVTLIEFSFALRSYFKDTLYSMFHLDTHLRK